MIYSIFRGNTGFRLVLQQPPQKFCKDILLYLGNIPMMISLGTAI